MVFLICVLLIDAESVGPHMQRAMRLTQMTHCGLKTLHHNQPMAVKKNGHRILRVAPCIGNGFVGRTGIERNDLCDATNIIIPVSRKQYNDPDVSTLLLNVLVLVFAITSFN